MPPPMPGPAVQPADLVRRRAARCSRAYADFRFEARKASAEGVQETAKRTPAGQEPRHASAPHRKPVQTLPTVPTRLRAWARLMRADPLRDGAGLQEPGLFRAAADRPGQRARPGRPTSLRRRVNPVTTLIVRRCRAPSPSSRSSSRSTTPASSSGATATARSTRSSTPPRCPIGPSGPQDAGDRARAVRDAAGSAIAGMMVQLGQGYHRRRAGQISRLVRLRCAARLDAAARDPGGVRPGHLAAQVRRLGADGALSDRDADAREHRLRAQPLHLWRLPVRSRCPT